MSKKLSIIFGYRNRDVERVKRCFDSLKQQTFKDFEVIFVDYGSEPNFQQPIEELTIKYPFCKYVFNHTQGMPWNRSHALNTGIRFAQGEYILFGDVDLIYSPFVLEELVSKANHQTQVYSKVYFLDEKFAYWDSVNETNLNTIVCSTESGKGGVHIVKKSILEQIQGYDEYYCFWGVEDRDLSGRIEQLNIKTEWIEETQFPVFHQWHADVSRAKKGFFPDKWWEKMNIHFQLNIYNTVRNDADWGRLFLLKDRIAQFSPVVEFNMKQTGGWLQKGKFAIELIEMLQINKGKTITLSINKQNFMDKYLEWISSAFQIFVNSLVVVQDSERYFQANKDAVFVIWTLIKETKLISDYAIVDNGKSIEVKLISN